MRTNKIESISKNLIGEGDNVSFEVEPVGNKGFLLDGIFAHSAKDGILVLLVGINVAAILLGAIYFSSAGFFSLIFLAFFLILMVCTNYQCISHNHLHNPFFNSKILNSVFSMVNSAVLGMSQTLYRIHHLNHHVFNNDYKNEKTSSTGDWSSFYRWSTVPGRPENIFKYSILGPLRIDYITLSREASRKGLGLQVWLDHFFMVFFFIVVGFIDWKFLVFYFLPVFYLGQAAALAENYLEHHGSDPTNRKANSVSCYSRFYNFVWFNNGFHQEHHFRPQVHWTEIQKIKALMLPESERRVVKGSHLGNLFLPGIDK